MTPPAPMKCLKTGCEWHTPQNCPTWANQIELLKIHTNVEHPQAVPVAGASAGAGAGTGHGHGLGVLHVCVDLQQFNLVGPRGTILRCVPLTASFEAFHGCWRGHFFACFLFICFCISYFSLTSKLFTYTLRT